MTRPRFLIMMLVAVSGCGVLGSAGPEDALQRFAEGEATDEWDRADISHPLDIMIDSGAAPLVAVRGNESYDGDRTITDVIELGSCDAGCSAAIGDVKRSALEPSTTPTATGFLCGNCSSADFLTLFEVTNRGMRAIDAAELIAAISPIETPYEVSLAFGGTVATQRNGNDWRIIPTPFQDCFPVTTEHTMWSLTSDGELQQLASYVSVPDPDEPLYCA